MHLVKSTDTKISEINFNGTVFYSSHIITYSSYARERFIKNCTVPIITKHDKSVTNFKYLVTVNTLFKIFDNRHINVALFDKNCNIIHLLPRLISKCRSVYVYTEQYDKYEAENNRVLSYIGAAAVISNIPIPPKNTDAIISAEPYHCDTVAVFGEYGYFPNDVTPVFNNCGALTLPDYTDIYTALTGLFNICKIKDIGNAYCEELSKNGYRYSI